MNRPKTAVFAVLVAAAAVAWLMSRNGPSPSPVAAVEPSAEQVWAPEPAETPQMARAEPRPNPGPAAPAHDEPSPAALTDDEQGLMDRIRAPGADPAEVLALVHAGNDRYPDSPLVEERAQRAIDALVALGSIGEAHREAEQFIERWPSGERAVHVMNLMGVHPRPKPGPTK
jgi:hypothetical protein